MKTTSEKTRQRSLPLLFALIILCFVALVFGGARPSEAGRNDSRDSGPNFAGHGRPGQPTEFDVRGVYGVPRGTEFRAPNATQLKAIGALQFAAGGPIKVQYNGLTATPRHLFVEGGYLTQPSAADPETIARNFLHQWSGIFRFSEDDLTRLKLKSRATLPDTGTTILLFEQQIDGVPVYHGDVLVNVNGAGRVIDVGGESFPQLAVNNAFAITPAQAVTSAAAGVNVAGFIPQSLGTTQVLAKYGVLQPEYVTASKFSRGSVFGDDIVVEKVIFPMGDLARAAYKMTLTTPRFNNIMWQSIVDAQTGAVLRRVSLTSFVGPGGGGVGVGRRPTFRPDIQDLLEGQGNVAGAQGKVFDTVPAAITGTGGFGGSTRTGTNPGNYVYTSPTYGLESPLPTDANGRGFRYSLVQARNEDPLSFQSTPSTFTHAQIPGLLGQVLRGFPDALHPSASSPFGWFYLPTGSSGAEIATGNSNRASTRAGGYNMANEAKTRNSAANSPTGNGDQPFSATLTPLGANTLLTDGRSLNSVFESNYTEGNNVLVADDRENDNEVTHGIKGYAPNRQFTAGYYDYINSYYYGGVDATDDNGMGLPCDPIGVGPCIVTYPASANPDVYPGAVNLFYFNNIIHDYLYSIGFTEPLWNFQQDNFGKGGAGGDAVSAQVQDGSGTDNANMGTPAEGGYPRMQMYLFTSGSFLRGDGSVDWDVVAHEHYHGVSNRSAAKGGDSCLGIGLVGESGGMGEGWSDYNASSLSDDDAEGEYVTGEFDVGIRRLPITNFRWSYGAINGCTLSRRDQGTADHDVLCTIPFEVHSIGEVWSATLWDMRELLIMKQRVGSSFPGVFFDGNRRLGSGASFFIGDRSVQSVDAKHPIDYRTTADSPLFDDTGATNLATGLPAVTINAAHHIVRPGVLAQEIATLGNRQGPLATAVSNGARLSDTLVLRGLQLSPCNPTFIDSRDSILRADRELTGGENQAVIWRAFASHGVGLNAASSGGGHDPNGGAQSAPTIVEDFTVPAGVSVCETLGPLPAPDYNLANSTLNTVTLTITPVAGAANYVIARANTAAGPFLTIADIPSTQTVYQDNDGGQGLAPGQTYFYQVHAGRSAECVSSAQTNSITVTVGDPVSPAPIFSGLDQVLDTRSCTSLTLSWGQAFSTNPNASIVYDIYRMPTVAPGDGTQDPAFTPVAGNRLAQGFTGLSFIDHSLLRNQVYYYIVQARDTNNGKLDTNNTGNTIVRWNAPTSAQVTNFPAFALENFEGASANSRFSPPLVDSATPNQNTPVFQRVPNADLGGGVVSSVIYAPDLNGPTDGNSNNNTVIGPLTLTPDSLMEFDQRFSAETGFDGGVIEIALNAPTFNSTPFPDNTTTFDLGNYIIQGGYNAKLDASELGTGVIGSPLQGRRGYTGVKALHHVRISLKAFGPGGEHAPTNGQVYIRFRMTADAASTAGTNAGWYIDNLVVNNLDPAACAGPSNAPATISGRIATPDGSPVGGTVVRLSGAASKTTITDSNGNYRFDNVPTGNLYTVTPGLANYHFSPTERSFSLVGNQTDAGFTANRDANDTANAIDTAEYFVRQQYLDFLGREPDQGGFEYWSGQINQCNGDAPCIHQKRIDVSAAYFMSLEFQQTGEYVYGLYAATLGRTLNFGEFMADRARVLGGSNLDQEKTAFALDFVQRPEFTNRYPQSMTRDQFVDAVLQTMQQRSGIDVSSQRAGLLNDYDNGGRALVVRHASEAGSFMAAEHNKAFVLMQYFGYLRRDVDQNGYDFWLGVLNQSGGNNFRGMVCSFLTSAEYQNRFSTVVTRTNAECAGVQ